MDGPFYVDTRAPHINADIAAVTLAATAKALVPVANLPVLGSNYFGWVGKAIRMRLWGRITTGATPGNMTAQIMWGNGAGADGLANQLDLGVGYFRQMSRAWCDGRFDRARHVQC